jgi:hypothetical protein
MISEKYLPLPVIEPRVDLLAQLLYRLSCSGLLATFLLFSCYCKNGIRDSGRSEDGDF